MYSIILNAINSVFLLPNNRIKKAKFFYDIQQIGGMTKMRLVLGNKPKGGQGNGGQHGNSNGQNNNHTR